jgi:hypothetical protein
VFITLVTAVGLLLNYLLIKFQQLFKFKRKTAHGGLLKKALVSKEVYGIAGLLLRIPQVDPKSSPDHFMAFMSWASIILLITPKEFDFGRSLC